MSDHGWTFPGGAIVPQDGGRSPDGASAEGQSDGGDDNRNSGSSDESSDSPSSDLPVAPRRDDAGPDDQGDNRQPFQPSRVTRHLQAYDGGAEAEDDAAIMPVV